MSRKKKPLPIIENVTIEDIAAEGKSIVHIDDKVVFAPYCVPGDVVDLQIKKKRKNYCEAEVIRFHHLSDNHIKPKCQHFGICGGCKWQILPYEEQLKAKQKQVTDQLQRIGKLTLPPINTIIGSEEIYAYRNKLEFSCSNKKWLTKEQIASGETFDNMNGIGFHIQGAFDKIYPIDKCWLMDDLHNRIRNEIYQYAIAHDITFFDPKGQQGLLRDIIIRHSNTGEWMVIIQFKMGNNNDHDLSKQLLQHISNKFPEISSLLYIDNQKCNDTIGDQQISVFKGREYIMETMEDLMFKINPKSFYQTNSKQAYKLYSVAREFADLSGKEVVYDLYTGIGSIANFVAKNSKKVIGIEYVPEAIEDAKENSKLNNITNTEFFAGDMKDILTNDFIAQHGKPDVIITDPPRAGMHPDVIKTIMDTAPDRIVYVSCNPATQARDIALMGDAYTVKRVQPVDMFPHTVHVENVVLLEKHTS